MSKKILLKGDSRKKILEGIELLADAVQSTLGPSGKTVIIHDDPYNDPFITKDGVTVAQACNSSDPVMNAGIQMIKSVASKMNLDNDDGTTTVTVICRELIKLGMTAAENENFNEHDFKTAINQCLKDTLEIISKNIIPITLKDIYKIAYTSSNNDEKIATLFQMAYDNAKEEGYINIAESATGESYVDVIKGFVLDMGFSERKYANDSKSGFFKAQKCNVILYDNDFTDKKEMDRVVQKFAHMATMLPLLIIAKDFSKDVERIVDYINLDKVNLQICLIKNQLRNDEYHNLMADLSNFTGADICSEYDDLEYTSGIVHNLIVKPTHTIFGEPQNTQAKKFTDYILELKEKAANEKSEAYKEQILKRVANMTNGITTLYVGGNSALEIKEKRHRVDDAYGACRAALQSNVIVGGSTALMLISREFKKQYNNENYQHIFADAIAAPFRQILLNSNHTETEISDIAKTISWTKNYNAKSRKFESFKKSGVVDPVKVVVGALVNSISTAMAVLSTECLIVETGNDHRTAQ